MVNARDEFAMWVVQWLNPQGNVACGENLGIDTAPAPVAEVTLEVASCGALEVAAAISMHISRPVRSELLSTKNSH